MIDLEATRDPLPIQFEKNYQIIDRETLRSTSRGEDKVIFESIVPDLRRRGIPVYQTKFLSRATISTTPLGVAEAADQLHTVGYRESNEIPLFYSWGGGETESVLSE